MCVHAGLITCMHVCVCVCVCVCACLCVCVCACALSGRSLATSDLVGTVPDAIGDFLALKHL